jgi:Mor family transcriptional regulator
MASEAFIFEAVEDYLPDSIRELVALIGLPATEKLVKRFGGTYVYVPSPDNLAEDHPLAALIGLEAARKVAGRCRNGKLKIALGREAMRRARNAEIVRLYYKGGWTMRDLAREFDLDERQIHTIVHTTPLSMKDSRQGDLFL